jgi:FAD/FMN-containing dehydrogenase
MASLYQRLVDAVDGQSQLIAFSNKPFFQFIDVRRNNLEIPVIPAAITYPQNVDQVAAIVKCASDFQLHVQARSGGHSYGNYGTYFSNVG